MDYGYPIRNLFIGLLDYWIIEHYSHLFFEFEMIFLVNLLLHEVSKCEDILPCSLLIIDEEVPMSITHFHSPDPQSLQSCIIDKLPCWEWFWVFEKWSTWESWWLLHLANSLDIRGSKFTIFCILIGWDVEEYRYDKISFIALQDTIPIDIMHLIVRIDLDHSCLEIEDLCLDEQIRHLDTETPSIPDTGSSHRSRESYPWYEDRYPIVLIESECEYCTDLSTMHSDICASMIFEGFTIATISIPHDNPLIHIEGKETIRSTSDDHHRDSLFPSECCYDG